MNERDCEHPGLDSKPRQCPDCGKFSRHSWSTGPFYTQNGYQESWGGTCSTHGEWSDDAA